MAQRWAQAEWIRGHILSGMNCNYMEMKDWTGIKTSNTLSVEIDGETKSAMQWVFKDSGERKFEENCAGKGWIHDMGFFFMSELKDT